MLHLSELQHFSTNEAMNHSKVIKNLKYGLLLLSLCNLSVTARCRTKISNDVKGSYLGTVNASQHDCDVSVIPTSKPSHIPESSQNPSYLRNSKPSIRPTEHIMSVSTNQLSSSPSSYPSNLPLDLTSCEDIPTQKRIDWIKEEISEFSKDANFSNNSTAHSKALNWITYDDELNLCPTDSNFYQRYTMALLYSETDGDHWMCGSSTGHTSNCEEDRKGVRFLSQQHHECRWFGIVCNKDQRVTGIHLCKFLFYTTPSCLHIIKNR